MPVNRLFPDLFPGLVVATRIHGVRGRQMEPTSQNTLWRDSVNVCRPRQARFLAFKFHCTYTASAMTVSRSKESLKCLGVPVRDLAFDLLGQQTPHRLSRLDETD